MDVDNSNTRVEIPTANIEMEVSASWMITFNASQYLEIATWGDATAVRWVATAAGATPTRPAAPSVHLSIIKAAD